MNPDKSAVQKRQIPGGKKMVWVYLNVVNDNTMDYYYL